MLGIHLLNDLKRTITPGVKKIPNRFSTARRGFLNQDQFEHSEKEPAKDMVEQAIEEGQELLNQNTNNPYSENLPKQKPKQQHGPKHQEPLKQTSEPKATHHPEEVHPEHIDEKESSRERSVPKEEEVRTENKLTPKALEREEHLPEGLTREELANLERLEKEKISFKHGDKEFRLQMVFLNQCYRDEKAAFERTKREITKKDMAEHIHLASLERSTFPTFFTDFILELEALKHGSGHINASDFESLVGNCQVKLAGYKSAYAYIGRPCPFDFTAMSNELESFRKKVLPSLDSKINLN